MFFFLIVELDVHGLWGFIVYEISGIESLSDNFWTSKILEIVLQLTENSTTIAKYSIQSIE